MKNHKVYITLMLGLVITSGFCYVAQAADAGNNKVEHMVNIKRLLEVANTKSPSIPVPEEIEKSRDMAKRKQYFEERHRKFQEVEAKREQARNELAAMGEEIIEPILDMYRRGRYRSNIIRVLKKIGTPKARVSLLNISLERNGLYNLGTLAAQNYIELTENKEDIKKLLASSEDEVLSVALQNLPGVTIDSELLKRLDELLQSTQYHPVLNYAIRTKAAAVIAADTGSVLMQEKVSAIAKSLDTVEQMPKSIERFQNSSIGTFADRTYLLLAMSLEKLKGADAYLSEATNRLTGNPRRWVLAVRARRGDPSVKNEIRNFLEYPKMLERTTFRSYALQGYEKIGTVDDIDFLRNIAESDPLIVLDRGGPMLETINGKPINNIGERAVIYDEFSIPEWEKLNPRQRIPLIRGRAQQAIQAIEKRIQN